MIWDIGKWIVTNGTKLAARLVGVDPKIIEENSFLNACEVGNYASSKIVQEKSPRLSIDQYKMLKANY